MKKTIFLLFAFVIAFSLNSCSSDDDSSSASSGDKIVGTWKFTGEMINGNFEPDITDECDEELLIFSANNTGKIIDKYCDDVDDVYPFTWEKTGDSPFNYVIVDSETGQETPGIIVFSSDFKKFTAYNSEQDMIDEDFGTVYEKQ
jgi:hypothetical protein